MILPNDFSTRVQMLLTLRNFKTVAELARDLGYDRSEKLARVMRSPGAAPSADVLSDVAKRYVNLNLNWWLTGEGEPTVDQGDRLLTVDELQQGLGRVPNPAFLSEPSPRYGLVETKKPDGTRQISLERQVVHGVPAGEPNIIMLDSRAAAGLPANYGNAEFFSDKPAFSLPGWKFKGDGMIALQVTGDSMAPTVHHDDWIVARRLVNPAEELKEGYIHLLVTKDGAVAKRIFRAEGGRHALICKSDNEDYPAYEIEMGPNDQLYVALGLISEDLSNKGGGVRDRLRQLEKDVLVLQHTLSIKKR